MQKQGKLPLELLKSHAYAHFFMFLTTFLSHQARKPSGIVGHFYMPRTFGKKSGELNDLVLRRVAAIEGQRLLEIGFGSGTAIMKIAESCEEISLEGVDHSKVMVAMAKRENAFHIRAGKVRIHHGDFNEVSFVEDGFDTIYTVNTIYFWENPQATVAKIFRLLQPGGRAVIGFHKMDEMEKKRIDRDVFNLYSVAAVKDLLSENGFADTVELVEKKGRGKTCYCAVAVKPPV